MLPLHALSYRSGAPAGFSGAATDGGNTCAAVGCHSGAGLNQGSGQISVSGASEFTPGTPLDLEITVSETGASVIGFQVSVADESDAHYGSLELVDGAPHDGGSGRPIRWRRRRHRSAVRSSGKLRAALRHPFDVRATARRVRLLEGELIGGRCGMAVDCG